MMTTTMMMMMMMMMTQVLEVSIMYEISDYAESPDVEYPSVPPKHSFGSLSQQNANAAGPSASYTSLSYNGKVSTSPLAVSVLSLPPPRRLCDQCCLPVILSICEQNY